MRQSPDRPRAPEWAAPAGWHPSAPAPPRGMADGNGAGQRTNRREQQDRRWPTRPKAPRPPKHPARPSSAPPAPSAPAPTRARTPAPAPRPASPPRSAAGANAKRAARLSCQWMSPCVTLRWPGGGMPSKPFRDGIAVYHFVKAWPWADNRELIAVHQHFGDQGPRIILAAHHRAVSPGRAEGHQIA